MSTKKTQPMIGTEGSTYNVVAELADGRIGYRDIGGGRFRIRIVPSDSAPLFKFTGDWKKPGDGGQNRYSTVVTGQEELLKTIAHAVAVVSGAAEPEFTFEKTIADIDGDNLELTHDSESGTLDFAIGGGAYLKFSKESLLLLVDTLNEYLDQAPEDEDEAEGEDDSDGTDDEFVSDEEYEGSPCR